MTSMDESFEGDGVGQPCFPRELQTICPQEPYFMEKYIIIS